MAPRVGRMGLHHLSGVHVVRHPGLIMGFTAGLISIAFAAILLFFVKAKDGVEKPFARNWISLIGVTMTIVLLLIAGSPRAAACVMEGRTGLRGSIAAESP